MPKISPLLLLIAALAQPVLGAPECEPAFTAEQAVQALNRLRATPRACLPKQAAHTAPPLRWDDRLAATAQSFAAELAPRDGISHVGGAASSSLRERLRRGGYRMRVGGENLAAGPMDLDGVLAQWLTSPEHCDNLMLADFQDVGLACVPGTGQYERFWVLHLARSLPE